MYHAASGTKYEFVGRGYIQYLKSENSKVKATNTTEDKMRKFKKERVENPRESSRI